MALKKYTGTWAFPQVNANRCQGLGPEHLYFRNPPGDSAVQPEMEIHQWDCQSPVGSLESQPTLLWKFSK